jgi:hypothetical protein
MILILEKICCGDISSVMIWIHNSCHIQRTLLWTGVQCQG